MRKRLVAAVLTAALLMTNTGVVYAAETTETDIVSIQSSEESAAESGETDETIVSEDNEVAASADEECTITAEDENKVQDEGESYEKEQETNGVQYAQIERSADEYDYIVTDGKVTITKYHGAGGDVVVPDTIDGAQVVQIGSSAFRNLSNINSVALPEGITKIEEGAFANCTQLSTVNLPSALTEIGAHAFYNCDLIETITIPKSLEKTTDAYINEYAHGYVYGPFYGCNGLKIITFEEGSTVIANGLFANGESAFYQAENLANVEFGKNVTEIKGSAFAKCGKLTRVEMNDKVEKMESAIFAKCAELSEVKLSGALKEMGAHSFYDCDKLTEIEIPIPKSLEKTTDAYINEYAYGYVYGPFYECDGLKEITFEEGSTVIANGLFANCPGIEEIAIPDTVTTIGESAFYQAENLANVEFGENVTEIKGSAFAKCGKLTRVEMNDKVEKMESAVFAKCTELSKVKLSGALKEMGAHSFYDCDKLTEIEIPKSLEKTTDAYIYEYAYGYVYGPFYGCDGLRKVTFEEGSSRIANGLFANCPGLENMVLPESICQIKDRAFENCANLMTLELPDQLDECNENAFSGCHKLTLLCNYGTNAHIFAIEKGMSVQLMSYAYEDFSGLAIEEGCTYNIDYNALNTSGYVKVSIHYEIKESMFTSSDKKYINLFVPSGAEVYQETIRMNGELAYDYTLEDRKLSIPIEMAQGDISYGFSPESVTDLSTAAVYEYVYGDKTEKELIGFDNSSRSLLSINADSVVSSPEVNVRGLGDKSSEIELYINQELATTVQSSKTGSYEAELTLPQPENGKIYIIEARNSNAQDQVAQTQVRYNDAAPVLTDFKLYYNNHSDTVIDLMNTESKPYISFNPQVPFTFVADFDNTEEIENVYIVSTRNNERKIMEAQYDEDKGQYIASGYFDDNNHSYVPSNLTVEYNLRKEEVQVGQEVDWTGMYNSLPENLKKAQITEIKGENGDTCYRFDMSQVAEGFQDVVVDLTISEISKVTGIGVDEWFDAYKDAFGYAGYVIPGLSGERYDAVTSSDGLKMGLVVAKDLTNITNDAVKIELEFQSPGSYGTLNEFSETLGTIAPFVSAASDIYGFAQDKDQLITEINQSPTITNKGEARQKAEQLFNDQMMYTLLVAMLPLLVASVGITGPVATAFTGLLAMIGATSSFFWEARVNNIKGNEFSIRWGIDPSGYVYEAVEDNRIEGVKTTAYYKENAEDEEAILWDASEYEQRNPLYTDTEGRYSWDVPEGYWQVKYEKEGYETVYSDWMPVPPPQTDVNIGLVSKEKPVIESFTVYADHADVVFSKYMIPDTVSSLKLSDQNGNDISYELEYDTTSVNSEGVNYAKEYTLRFTGNSVLTPESTCRLTADGSAKSYADVAMDAGETVTVVNKNIEIIAPDKAVVKMGETLEIPVMVANASEELSFTAVSEFEEIASVTEIGKNSIKVTGNMYGEADITISVPGTDLVKTIRVTVGKTTEEAEVTPTVVLPQSVYTMKAGDELTVTPEVYPETAEGSWSIISGENVLAVNGNTFTAQKSGEAALRYTLTEYEDIFAECRIIVGADGDVVRGDADGNKTVDIADLRMVLRSVCGKVDLTEQQKLAADVTDDGRVDIQDLRKILRYVCRKIDEL